MPVDVFGLFKATSAELSSAAKAILLQLRGVGDEGDDSSAEPVDSSPWLQSVGLAVRPVVASTLRVLGVRWGDEVWGVKVWDRSKSPTDLESGETRLYPASGAAAKLRMRAAGAIEMLASGLLQNVTISGAKTVIQGGAGEQKAARKNDPVNGGSIQFITSTILGSTIFTVQFFKADGTPVGTPQQVTLGSDATVTLPLAGGRIDAGSSDCLIGGLAS